MRSTSAIFLQEMYDGSTKVSYAKFCSKKSDEFYRAGNLQDGALGTEKVLS